jgi:outer membrane receptor protein involved in Fe transport
LRTPKAILSGAIWLWATANALAAQAISIPSEDLRSALDDYIRQSGLQLIYNVDDISGVISHEVRGLSPNAALNRMLEGTGISAKRDSSGAVIISRRAERHGGPVAVEPPTLESVTVTGTRILNNQQFPPPVTAISTRELSRLAPSNLPDGLNKLPMFAPAQTSNSAVSGANGRGFRPNGNFLDLRGLGPNRTLILQDGLRVPATFYDGTVDTNTLPQMLVERVEIVTGGASAVYGSDAVSGVVNFILNRQLEGFKALLQAGISQYGDAKSFRAGLAGGQDVFDHGHILWSLEYYDRAAITDQGARAYGNLGTAIVGSGTSANPYLLVTGIRKSDASFGGLATSGPFAGQQFIDGGVLAAFNAGSPTGTGGASIGGDGGIVHNEYLLPVMTTFQTFARMDYGLTSDLEAHIQASYAGSRTFEANQIIFNTSSAYPLTIYSGNAFLSQAEQAALTATSTDFFTFNRFDDDLSRRLGLKYQTSAATISGGLKGVAWDGYSWNASYTHGETRTRMTTLNNANAQRLYAAVDAVRDPQTGSVVCRVSLTAPGAYPSCVPLDLFGPHAPSEAALNYVEGTTAWTAHNGLDDFVANITGRLFDGWAGPIKAAAGMEYQLQTLSLTTTVPDTGFNPQYLRVGGADGSSVPAGNLKWIKETQSAAQGDGSVYESDIELDVPLLGGLPGIELLSFDGAYRYTHYSTAGPANTWKVALDWQAIDDIRLRGSYSRDIRAPTLFDLFQGPLTSSSGISDSLTNTSGNVNTTQAGNPDLKPEVAHNATAGLVFTPWDDISLSLDYFHIDINNAIGAVTGGNPIIQNLCLASSGTSPLCKLIVRPISYNDTSSANFPLQFFQLKENIAKTYTEGIDLQANYQVELSRLDPSWNGTLHTGLFWTHQPVLKTQTLPGTLITNAAGTAQIPVDRMALTAGTRIGPYSLELLERYQSGFHQNANPTLIFDVPDVRAYFQTDLDLSYDFASWGQNLTTFLNIGNLFNAQGGIYQIPSYTGSPGLNYPVGPGADIVGRYFTLGVRLNSD